ncbi:group II intron reverse transcriptase/maturase [Bacillus paranthracis]|uniref:group II intron reverse transcriptase/maturase n=1 Tax=Bacillus paranthracis TaxID=2026186 RepID=UPI0013D1E5CA
MKSTTETSFVSAATPITDYDSIPWVRLEKYVRRLQQRIYRAENLGKKREVKNLQRLLMRSKAALLLSIRQVTQINKGKRTAGVDGYKVATKKQRMELYNKLKDYNIFMHNPSPALRKYIPKGKGKLRPLGIPIIIDRIFQNVTKMALEPQWEQRFESTSYGFRPKRSTHDAVVIIYNKLHAKTKKKWIFEGDFKGCFDNLNHDYILEQLAGFPAKETIARWLKAGFVDNNVFTKTESGTPQGGIVSPLLANIALHGMEEEIGVNYRSKKEKKTGKVYHEVFDTKTVVRYADDFVIICETKEEAESMYDKLKPYLTKRGLELAPEKTNITHITEGFDFLGFNFRQYATCKEKGRLWKLIVKPSKKSQAKMMEKTKECFKKHQGNNVQGLIMELIPIIRGYANYWRSVQSKEIFSKMDAYIWKKTKHFVKRLHPNKPWKWIYKQYFQPDIHGQSKDRWLLTAPNKKYQMIKMVWTGIVKHIPITYKNSPYDKELREYYHARDIKKFERDTIASRQKLAKKQKHKCPLCRTSLLTGEALETHHKKAKAKGGTDEYKNLALVHGTCHILWHKTFPAKGTIPSDKQMKAFSKMLNKKRKIIQ